MIGLVLGDTHIGGVIIKKLKLLKKKLIIIDISKRKLYKKNINSFSLSIGQLGKCISILKKNNCKKVIFAGRVKKPNFSNIKFDSKAILYLPKIIKETRKGDAYIINLITKIFLKECFKVINQAFFNPELLLKKGNYTKIKPDSVSKKDILLGKKIINNLKNKGVAQGVVIANGKTIVEEDPKGTDFMLQKAKSKMKKILSKRRQGILVKLPKPNQDLRTDLPTVGITTVKKCARLGLKGIVVQGSKNIFLDKSKCINIANKNKMFICAI